MYESFWHWAGALTVSGEATSWSGPRTERGNVGRHAPNRSTSGLSCYGVMVLLQVKHVDFHDVAVCPVGLTMVNELLDDIDLTKLSAVLRKLLLLRREESPLAPIRANELILVVTHLVNGPAILSVARRMIAEPLAVHFPGSG
jgi:hypothetical protein